MRFVSFLDILGFTELVDSGQLADVQAKLESALEMVPYSLPSVGVAVGRGRV
jgi:hypothetical protein